jgi:hypothetical protein
VSIDNEVAVIRIFSQNPLSVDLHETKATEISSSIFATDFVMFE